MTSSHLITRYEVQERRRSGAWGSLWGEGPVRFDTREEAEAECSRLTDSWAGGPALRIFRVEGIVRITALDIDEFVFPLVVRFWRLHRPGEERGDRLQPMLDPKRQSVVSNWAILSGWEGRPIYFAPEVELPRLRKRFPFARPQAVEGILRLLTLHELAHYLLGHNGLSVSLDHTGSRDELRAKFATMETAADALTVVLWKKGLSEATVKRFEPPPRRPNVPRLSLCEPRAIRANPS